MLRFGFYLENVRKGFLIIDKGEIFIYGIYFFEIIVDFILFVIKMFVLNILMFIVKFFFIVKVFLL